MRIVNKELDLLIKENAINVTMFLHPIFYKDSELFNAVSLDEKVTKGKDRYHTDINPERVINGPLSKYGEELEPPIKEEWNNFIDDCKWLIEEVGFTIIQSTTSLSSKKSEYVVIFGMRNRPCGSLVYDMRLSDHPFDAVFPDEAKTVALNYLKMNQILDGTATEVGIDFQVEKITVGSVHEDTWDRAFGRLYNSLKRIRRKVGIRLNRNRSK